MERIILLLAFITTGFAAFGQDQVSSTTHFSYLESIASADAVIYDEECVFLDDAERVCYVDFQKIQFNLKEVNIIDAEGNVVYSRNVSDLPVDAILEIDFSEFKNGKYIVELRSYVSSMHRRISLS
jgi:hypothetical protein